MVKPVPVDFDEAILLDLRNGNMKMLAPSTTRAFLLTFFLYLMFLIQMRNVAYRKSQLCFSGNVFEDMMPSHRYSVVAIQIRNICNTFHIIILLGKLLALLI